MRDFHLLSIFLLILLIFGKTESSELSRCCSGGARHFQQTATCSAIRSEGSSMLCVRTASICCLRSLMDASCDAGATMGKNEQTCPTNINVLGGGLKKECCDCCLLAQELVRRNEPCLPPNGFSAVCLRSFNRCCQSDIEITPAVIVQQKQPTAEDGSLLRIGDRCLSNPCDHLCTDSGGENVECSCRDGFDLGADGTSCIDIDECSRKAFPCRAQTICINTKGSFICRPFRTANRHKNANRTTSARSSKLVQPPDRSRTEPRTEPRTENEKRQQQPLTYAPPQPLQAKGARTQVDQQGHSLRPGPKGRCPKGYELRQQLCFDIDECILLLDGCLEGQRCLNVPGSYKCIRTLSCGTGYVMDSETEQCTDVDECNLGSHDCGSLYQCRNTQGSYRCVAKKCADGELQNPVTGECTSIHCPTGYYPKEGRCNDIDECVKGNPCLANEDCVNTPGAYRCQQRGNPCTFGYQVNPNSGFCEDVDECLSPNSCGGMECTNLPGSFRCKCPQGYEFDEKTKRCEDIDECIRFSGHVCDVLATCSNTIGSFLCTCKTGFELALDGRKCVDIDECSRNIARCAQKCVNIPGSYQCICDRGYALGPDGVTCEDIDECSLWSGTDLGNELCMGECINTPGAYTCKCPPGYRIQPDGRTCVDIDECAQGECQGSDRVCVNTLGHFKCHRIECPSNYVHDIHITWQFIGLPKNVPLTLHRPSVTLFTIKGPATAESHVQFELVMKRASPEEMGVIPAIRANFLLQKGNEPNTAVVAMRDSLDGPQLIELELILRLTRNGHFAGKYLANLVIHISPHEKRKNHFFHSIHKRF
ncbi:unnamed protein product, partial [Mesorhabditis belari]|uniref:Fibulin-1 n=1 Tax=Mesorhabditis belari TaxID=2138241 RepID=A0AAF3FH21_9BILA